MLPESMEALITHPDGIYLDCSFGGGGHTRGVLDRVSARARVYAIDRDPHAIHSACIEDTRLTLEKCPWSELNQFAQRHNLFGKIKGALLDVGVSSMQLDVAERGFSFKRDGPLDMRMDPENGVPASEWINTASSDELKEVFRYYGEEPRAKRVAQAIVQERIKAPIKSTFRLAKIAGQHAAANKHRHRATLIFQAIRIYINRELEELEAALTCVSRLLEIGGRMVTLSFHSLEDRMVKNFIRRQSTTTWRSHDEKGIPSDTPKSVLAWVIRRRSPSEREIQTNPRARSAHMRVAECVSRG